MAMDTGYSWVILTSAVLCNTCFQAVVMSVPLFLVSFIDVFNLSAYQAGWLCSVNAFIVATGALAGGFLIQQFSSRTVGVCGSLGAAVCLIVASQAHNLALFVATFSVLTAIFASLCRLPPIVIIQYYFDKKRPLANGIALLGYSLGIFLISPLVALWIEHYGWRGAIMMIAGFSLNMAAFMLLFVPNNSKLMTIEPHKSSSPSHEKTKRTCDCLSIYGNPAFLVILASFCTLMLGSDVMYKVIVPKVELDMGMDKLKASSALSAVSFGGLSGRIVCSFIANMPGVNVTLMYAIGVLLGGIVTVSTTFVKQYIFLMILAVTYGFLYGMACTVQTTVLVNHLGVDNVARTQGAISGLPGIVYLLTLPLSGLVYDSFGSFHFVFIMAGLSQLTGGLLSAVFYVVTRKSEFTSQTLEAAPCSDLNSIKQQQIQLDPVFTGSLNSINR